MLPRTPPSTLFPYTTLFRSYDRTLCLLPRDVVDFVLATQPKEWKKLEQHHGAAVKEQFLKRLAAEIERRGTLDVLRRDRKSTRLNSSHITISYAVFCLKKKK